MTALVWVDTTELRGSFHLTTGGWPELLAHSREDGVEVVVSEVSIREVNRQFAEVVNKELEAADGAVDGLKRKLHPNVPVPSATDQLNAIAQVEIGDYANKVRHTLMRSGVQILPLPDVSHEEVLDRRFEERKPFIDSGKGYQDTLIWESLLELLRNRPDVPELFLVSGNSKDFFEDESVNGDLKSDLDEIRDFSLIRCCTSIPRALPGLRNIVEVHRLTVPDKVDFSTDDPNGRGAKILAAVSLAAEGLVSKQVPDDYMGGVVQELHLDNGLADGYFVEVDPTELVVAQWIYDVQDEDNLELSVGVHADVEIETYIYKSDYESGFGLSVRDWDWNDHMMQVSLSREVVLTFEIALEGMEVTSVEFDYLFDAPVAS